MSCQFFTLRFKLLFFLVLVLIPLSSYASLTQDQLCSCVIYAISQGVKIPPKTNSWDLRPNSYPQVGGLALLDYNVEHVAVIQQVSDYGFLIKETNFKKCQFTSRWISWLDPHIRGFWSSYSYYVARI